MSIGSWVLTKDRADSVSIQAKFLSSNLIPLNLILPILTLSSHGLPPADRILETQWGITISIQILATKTSWLRQLEGYVVEIEELLLHSLAQNWKLVRCTSPRFVQFQALCWAICALYSSIYQWLIKNAVILYLSSCSSRIRVCSPIWSSRWVRVWATTWVWVWSTRWVRVHPPRGGWLWCPCRVRLWSSIGRRLYTPSGVRVLWWWRICCPWVGHMGPWLPRGWVLCTRRLDRTCLQKQRKTTLSPCNCQFLHMTIVKSKQKPQGYGPNSHGQQ